MSEHQLVIAGRHISSDNPPYLIAELSGNHNGDIGRAFRIMEEAKAAGADAVKLQTYTPDTMTLDHDGPDFRVEEGLWAGRSLYELYQEAHTPWDWMEPLFAKGRELGITVFSTPFDSTALDLLEQLDAPAYKIASFENGDHALIARVAATGKPMIISTGMATLSEIAKAVEVAREAGGREIAVLHCVSGYPTPAEEANLRTIPHLAQAVDAVVGLSDHTLGIGVSVASVALGAALIEKHFTLRRSDGGPDASFSLEPDELRNLVQSCRDAHAALGDVRYSLQSSEKSNLKFKRSLYAVTDLKKGETFTESNVRAIRPGFGLPPTVLPQVLGHRAITDIPRGTRLSWDLVAP